MKRVLLILAILWFATDPVSAQETFPRNGVYDDRPECYALVGAKVVTSPGEILDSATVVIRKGRITAVDRNAVIPDDAVVIELHGKYIYPSFIELDSDYGMPEIKAEGQRPRRQPQMLSNKDGAYSWNEALKTEFNAAEAFTFSEKEAAELRAAGIGTVLTHRHDGISRGTGAVVSTAEKNEHEVILKPMATHQLSFRKGSSTQNYPNSLMGIIALIRQTNYDAQWYEKEGHKEQVNFSLQAWNAAGELPQVFETGNWQEVLRAQKIAGEFDQEYIIRGSGDEYQRVEELSKACKQFILPLDFPEAYDLDDPYDAQIISLGQLMHWEHAPSNPAVMAEAGADIALTSDGLKKRAAFLGAIRKAVKEGLSPEDALKAVTVNPAKWLGIDDQIGTVEAGKWASLLITDEELFTKKGKILEHWVQGIRYVFEPVQREELSGMYMLTVEDIALNLKVTEKDKRKMEIVINDSTSYAVENNYDNGVITLKFGLGEKPKSFYRLTGTVTDSGWEGTGYSDQGQWISWSAMESLPEEEEETAMGQDEQVEKDMKSDTSSVAEKKSMQSDSSTDEKGKIRYPFNGYGWTERPEAETVFIDNATIWTNEKEGILENADILFRNGEIVEVGIDLPAPDDALYINGEGKHVTSGIIDEHTHIAVSRGVNEGTQYSSAEVRIGDVINSEDVNIYRQLAGGVVAAQVLHGSANPIGGQSGIIKFRWGSTPEELKIEDAMPFIKFALGENVKQSNWGDNNRSRFPQTRMGVEQVYEDHFTRAAEYSEKVQSGKPYRTDLEMEALAQILDGQRQITCHSYQQGEINMLMKVAERHGFRINTFTHILEGYKVADKMAEHGAGGSSFSDWWAYKYEVIDAIPYNGAIMQRQGVTVAFNSDDREMARRLNQEAAKAIQYGDLSEEEAWKFVTLNPAKLLHLDHRMGSLKAGKDADVVIWSDNPLSIYAKAEKTWVEGVRYYDRELEDKKQAEILAERERITRKMMNEGNKGGRGRKPSAREQLHYHCDTMIDEAK